tara:strand:- start:531 stop:1655 length:1125 start_codon:yes stop_codon:yes gene_type:complete
MLYYGQLCGADFEVFRLTGQRLLKNEGLYQNADGWSPFKYHPTWSLIFSLFSILPLGFSKLIFNILNLYMWCLGAKKWMSILEKRVDINNIFILMVIVLNSLSAELGYGQLNGYLFCGTTYLFYLAETDRNSYLKQGLILFLLTSLKLNFGILGVFLIFKNWKAIYGSIIGLVCFQLALMVSYGPMQAFSIYSSWLQLLLHQSFDQYNTFEVQGFLRFFMIHFDFAKARVFWLITMFISMGIGVYIDQVVLPANKVLKNRTIAINASYWLIMIFLFSPLSWWYQILFLFPAVFVLLEYSHSWFQKKLVLLILIVFAFVSYNTVGSQVIYLLKDKMIYFYAGLTLFLLFFWNFKNWIVSLGTISHQEVGSAIEKF